jgi:hypothetical protein
MRAPSNVNMGAHTTKHAFRSAGCEEFATVVSMEAELAEHLIAFLPEFKDVGGIPIERSGHKVDIADELLMADQLRA